MATKARIQLTVLGIKQKTIAAKVPCSEAYVNRCINGKQKPSQRLIEAACKITGLPAEALFEVKDS